MTISIGRDPQPLAAGLVADFRRVSLPTLGHYLEEGFLDPGIRRLAGEDKVVGRAVTVRITAEDSTFVHHAAGLLEPGDVLVVDTGGDARHAPVGEVIAVSAATRGAAGIVVDGVVTDLDEIERERIPVYARGTSALTTKLLGLDAGGLNIPVAIGGVVIRPGDLVVADRNGVFAADEATAASIIATALADDAEEPELIADVRAGGRLGDLTGASATVAALQEGAAR